MTVVPHNRRTDVDSHRLADEYLAGATLSALAKKHSITQATVRNRLDAIGVARRSRANRGPNNGRWSVTPTPNAGRLRAQRVLADPESCTRCQSTTKLHRHHIDEDTSNNAPSNLQWLCATCHIRHHIETWKRTGTKRYAILQYVDEWLARHRAGETGVSIARDYPCSPATVRYWLRKLAS